jgi:hypothetical protein
MNRPCLAASTACLLFLWATPALALDFGNSSTTGKGITQFPFGFGTPDDLPLGVDFGLRFAPNLSDGLGASNINPGLTETNSLLFDADLNLKANFRLADLEMGPAGRFKPILSPYVGYRYLGLPTVEFTDPRPALSAGNFTGASQGGSAISYSQFGGINYGVKAGVELPLGFEAHAGLGLTTLITGGWDTRKYDASSFLGGKAPSANVTDSGRIDPGNATLPGLNVGASWNIFHAFEISIGYETYILPTHIRSQGLKLDDVRTTINNLQVGVRLFSFSI